MFRFICRETEKTGGILRVGIGIGRVPRNICSSYKYPNRPKYYIINHLKHTIMRKPILFLTCLLVGMNVSAQSTDYQASSPQVIPPTPQSQLFEKYVNHPVTEYNGLPEITIPLYEIEIKGLKIPISLTYHASGIKYKQYDGDAGAGWSINAGGYKITRTVNGRDDEYFDMYDQDTLEDWLLKDNQLGDFHQKKDYYLARLGMDEETFKNGLMRSSNTPLDSEYDLFTYMLPSTNGHFIITDRPNKKVAILEQHNDSVLIIGSGSIHQQYTDVYITDDAGFRYYLGGSDHIESAETGPSMSSKVGWPLRQIVSPYNESVNFTYVKHDRNDDLGNIYLLPMVVTEAPTTVVTSPYGEKTVWDAWADVPIRFGRSGYNEFLIDRIQGEKETVIFVRDNEWKRIQSIEIRTKNGQLVKTIKLNYSPANNTPSNWHTLLTSIKIGEANETEKVYTFDYYPGPKPTFGDAGIDQWGYYSDKYRTVNNGWPWGAVLIHEEFLNHRIKFQEYNGIIRYQTLKECGIGNACNFVFFNRKENNTTPNYFSLKKITYPTGGSTTYEYEPHNFFERYYTVTGGGQRIKKITSDPGGGGRPLITEYTYGVNGDGSGFANFDMYHDHYYENQNRFIDKYFKFSLIPHANPIAPQYFFPEMILYTVTTFSMKPITPEMDDFSISYSEVTSRQYDGLTGRYNGKTISSYSKPQMYTVDRPVTAGMMPADEYYTTDDINLKWVDTYNVWEKPLLTFKRTYNDDNLQIKNESFQYSGVGIKEYRGIKIKQRMFFDIYWGSSFGNLFDPHTHVTSLFDYMKYKVTAGKVLLSSKETVTYDGGGETRLKETYEYDESKGQLVKTARNTSKTGESDSLKTFYTYPYNYTDPIHKAMTGKNMLSPVIEKYSIHNGSEIGRIKTGYGNNTTTAGLILPVSVQTSFTGAGGLEASVVYDLYDSKGNLLQYTGRDGVPVSFVWGYNQQYPIAKVTGATFAQVKAALGRTGDPNNDMAYLQNYSVIVLEAEFKKLRSYFTSNQVHVSTYLYKPLVGITSETDPRGISTYYEYDNFGRLMRVTDDTGKALEKYEYYYKNQ